jgi:tRNA threonylcarbamoyladenosine biosynthesis protein TsaE
LRIGRSLRPGAVVSLEGPLGAGKTVLVQGIARALGIDEPITSPTFTLISQYRGALDLYHVDLYRIQAEEEIEELGLEELMAGEGVVVIEWGEKAARFLPADAIRIRLILDARGGRHIRLPDRDP